jgi:hypothetical protein
LENISFDTWQPVVDGIFAPFIPFFRRQKEGKRSIAFLLSLVQTSYGAIICTLFSSGINYS